MYTAILLLFAHWVGDYALQTNEMANRKGDSLRWLNIHVIVYSLPILAAALILFDWRMALKYTLVNSLLHWMIDFTTTRIAGQVRDKPRLFYPIIGFDQFLHGACLLWTPQLLL
jgi:hypothetical protein